MKPDISARQIFALARSVLIALAVLGESNVTASSDEVWGFVKITCAPELGYFSIQRFSIMNLPHNGPYTTPDGSPRPDVDTILEKKYGIYDSTSLKANSFDCSIPALPSTLVDAPIADRVGFNVRIVGHVDTSSPTGSYAQMIDDAEVIFDGKSVAIMGLNPYGLVRGANSIEIARDGQSISMRICSLDSDSADKQTCERRSVR